MGETGEYSIGPPRDVDPLTVGVPFPYDLTRKYDGKRNVVASLYLHIPFCEHKCIYCDFYSVAPKEARSDEDLPMERFISALKNEILLRGQGEHHRVAYDTVFLGGGTPSLLSPAQLEGIFDVLTSTFSVSSDAEVTLEANPGTVDRAKLAEYRRVGFNRISFGVQSFHEDDLRFLTRIHTADEASRCVADAYASGFENVSIDLMFSLPGQTKERWRSNLERALALGPKHLSCYSLIVEPDTPLAHMVQAKQIALLEVDDDAGLYEMTMEMLDAAGYGQYEVSNFALPGYECRHNLSYWSHTNYLGLGPSAHSFWSEGGVPQRWWNLASVVRYNEALEEGKLPLGGGEHLSDEQLREEALFLGLRSDGVDVASFRRRFVKDPASDPAPWFDDLIERRLAVRKDGRIRLTPKGYLVCDEICASMHV